MTPRPDPRDAAAAPPMRQRTLHLCGHEILECHDPAHFADHSTRATATALAHAFSLRPPLDDLGRAPRTASTDDPSAERGPRAHTVVEIGCGTGVLAILAAKLGATRVIATDLDPRAIELLRESAIRNHVAHIVDAHVSSLLDAVTASERPDLIVGVLPQKPCTRDFSLRSAGGTDGTALLVEAIRQSAERLNEGGRLVLFHHSLAAPAVVGAALSRAFDWKRVRDYARCVTVAAYDALADGMLAHLEQLANERIVDVRRRGPHLVWRAGVLVGIRR